MRLILPEGHGDEAFFRQLIKVRKLNNFKVHHRDPKMKVSSGMGSFEALLRNIKLEKQYDDCKLIIVVADNDSNPSSNFENIVTQIKNAEGYAVPIRPREVATVDALRSVSVLMLPWDNVPGSLDSVCYSVASQKRPKIAACVEKYIKCVKASKWEPSPLGKLQLRCLLSASCPTDPNIGVTHAWSSQKRPKDLIPLECNGLYLKNIAKFLRELP